MSELYPDTVLENLPENDCFGTSKKAELIKKFIKDNNNKDYLKKNNMIVLYGNWGSGKSSVIKYIHDELNNDKNFICMTFDAWLYERDNNLSYSLLEFIWNKLAEEDNFKGNNEITDKAKKAIKVGRYVLGGLAKGIKFSVKTPSWLELLGGVPEVNFEYDVEKVVNHFDEKEEDNTKNKSYHQKVEELKTYFRELSELLESNNQRLIVFIDELDRCEAEHTLDLLASIKLFFSLGNNDEGENNIIYFVAVDKDGVAKAIKTRYGDIIKAEEYLEKIFNISFNMPKTFEIETNNSLGLKKFIMQYEFFNDNKIAKKLAKFFEAIKFTNPRHLKKVLNKYAILIMIKNLGMYGELIPEIIRIENETKKRVGYLFDTIFVLYFIILYEFYSEKYLEVKRYKYRVEHLKYISTESSAGTLHTARTQFKISISYFKHYSDKITNANDPLFNNPKLSPIKTNISNKDYFIKNIFRFNDIIEIILWANNDDKKTSFREFITHISTFLSCVGDENIDKDETNLTERYAKAGITVNFWEYVKNNHDDIYSECIEIINSKYSASNYPFTNLFKMAETLL